LINHGPPHGGPTKKEKKMKKIKAYGNEYPSMRSAAKALRMNYKTLWNRLQRSKEIDKFDTEIVVSIPNILDLKLEFISIDNKAWYSVPWSQDLLKNTRDIIEHYRPDLLSLYDKSNPEGIWNPMGASK